MSDDKPTPEAQEEFYKLHSALAHAVEETSDLLTAYIVADDEDVPNGPLRNYLSVFYLGDWDESSMYELAAHGLFDASVRYEHNARAVVIAQRIAAEVELRTFMMREENIGKAFRVFSDEVIDRAIRYDVPYIDFGAMIAAQQQGGEEQG